MRHYENMYAFGYLIAGVGAVLAVLALLTGASMSRGGRQSVSRTEEPTRFWIGMAVLVGIAVAGLIIAFAGR